LPDIDFTTRCEYPCNFDNCGGASYTAFNYDNHFNNGTPNGSILHRDNSYPDNSYDYTWTWTNPSATYNGYNTYDSPLHCLFNFNNVNLFNGNWPDSNLQALTNDVPFLIKINDSAWVTFYHSKVNLNNLPHGIDLATHNYLKNYYHDGPGQNNTLTLHLPNNPDPGVDLFLHDGNDGRINLYRVYKTKPCCPKITSSTVGSGTISPTPGPFLIPIQGKTFDMSANNGNYLSNVAVDGTSKGTSDPYTVQYSDLNPTVGMEGHTITATFMPNPINHTIYATSGEGGTIDPLGYVSVSEGSTPSFTIDAYDCYEIDSIIIDSLPPIQPGGTHYVYNFDPVYYNHTIHVTFSLSSQDHYPVFLNSGSSGNITIAVDGNNLNVGAASVVACVTANESHSFYAQVNATGYTGNCYFDYWDLQDGNHQSLGTSRDNPMVYTPIGVTYLQAMYTEGTVSTYSLSGTINSGNGTIIPSTAIAVESGSNRNAKVLLKPNSGYQLTGLTRNGNPVIGDVSNNQYTINSITTNTQMAATFTLQFTITASISGGYGSISPSGSVTVNQGGSQSFTITPCIGYAISGVTVDGASVGAVSTYQFTDIQEPHTIQAAFLPLYAITTAAGTGGTISPPGTTLVIQGGSQSYTITPNEGYSIYTVVVNNQWQGPISTYTFTNVQAPQTLQATFQQITYGIVSSAGTGGSISPSGGTIVNWGGSQEYYITPDYGYLISDVLVDGYSQGAISYYSFTNVQDNHTIHASFIQCQTCYTCQTACEAACQTGCEVNCQTGCEVSCQTGCEVSCQTGCQVACQTTCELACQTGCQVSCQTGCEVSCQSCNTCQTTCELACQSGCQISCETGCEVACQGGCQTEQYCPYPYYICQSCETCQASCEVSCQTSCELSCQTCNNCQICQTCQTIQYCPVEYYTCQSCETCQPAYT